MTEKVSGIYKIVNRINGKYYVGSSANIKDRWRQHRRALRKNLHWNDHLQLSWNKYKEPTFDFIVVETCLPQKDVLLSDEQRYLDIAKNEKDKCYNITFTAGKVDMTDDVRIKMSKAREGKYLGPNNTAYRFVPDAVKLELKNVWVQDGKNELILYAKNVHNIGGTVVCKRLIPEFKMDPNAVHHRKENKRLSMRKLYDKNCIFTGNTNVNYNPTIYRFRSDTGEIFCATQNEFAKKFGFYPNGEFMSGKRRTCRGWTLIDPPRSSCRDRCEQNLGSVSR